MYATTTAAVAALLLLGATSADDEEKIVKCGTTVISDGLKHRSRAYLGGGGGREPGELVSLKNYPWTVLLQYKLANGGNRDPCVGTLISDRHVLTARTCVDAEGPNKRSAQLLQPHEMTVFLDLMGVEGGRYNATSIQTLSNVDLPVLEIAQIELGEYARPICPSDHFDRGSSGERQVATLYWNPRKEGVPDLKRSDPVVVNLKRCIGKPEKPSNLAKAYPYDVTDKDYLCLYKRDLTCIEGYCVGGPVIEQNDKNARWLQFGVVVRAAANHNYALAIRVDVNAELIRNLTDCYLVGSGLDTVQTDDDEPGWHCKGEAPHTEPTDLPQSDTTTKNPHHTKTTTTIHSPWTTTGECSYNTDIPDPHSTTPTERPPRPGNTTTNDHPTTETTRDPHDTTTTSGPPSHETTTTTDHSTRETTRDPHETTTTTGPPGPGTNTTTVTPDPYNTTKHTKTPPPTKPPGHTTTTSPEHTTTTPHGPCPPNPNRTCGIDLMFLIDSSGSIGDGPFGKAREFLATVLDGLNIGPNDTRVGIIQFSGDASILTQGAFTSSKDDAKKAAEDMAYTAGATATEKALDLARESFVKHGRGESLGMPRVVVLITDGEPNRPAEATAAANALKGKGVIVFTVGIIGGDNINEANLRAMASDPKDQHYYKLDSYADLAKLFPRILLNTTCHVSAAISETTPDVTKTVDECESALFRVAANRSTGITLKLRPTQGSAAMYISLTNEEPNEHDNDGHTEAYPGHPGEVHVSPAQLQRSGHVFLMLAAQSNNNDQEAEVFTRIVGRAAKNDIVLHVDQGNTIKPPPIIDISNVGYRNTTKYGRLEGRHNYGDAEEACLRYHGSIPPMVDENNVMYLASALRTVPELRTTGRTWIFKGDSRHDGPTCHALDICKSEIVERDCSEELVSICEVPRKGFIADGKTDAEAKDACKDLSNAFELALARTDEELHYARQIVDEYGVKARLANHKGDDTPHGKTECGRGEYPWCKNNPKCDSAGNDVTLNPSYQGGCFNSEGADEKHSVLCKRVVAESVGPGQARLQLH